jgi:hypothetical protein
MGTLAEIRARTAEVVEQAGSVRIDDDCLRSFARELLADSHPQAALDPAHYVGEDPDTKLHYVVTLGAINFGSGWFPHLRKRPGCSGYFTIAGALEDEFRRSGLLSADELAAFTPSRCGEVFEQELSHAAMAELMGHFSDSLSQLGQYLVRYHGGSFGRLIEAAEQSGERLVDLLSEMPLYRDVSRYRGFDVPFYKRAQLTVADLSLAFDGESFGAFRDLDQLTLFADNLVPHVLRREGVLRYVPELAERIDRGERLARDCAEEIEIRAAAVQAVERMVEFLAPETIDGNVEGTKVNARVLDYWLWFRGQRPSIKSHPRHRTRTTAY